MTKGERKQESGSNKAKPSPFFLHASKPLEARTQRYLLLLILVVVLTVIIVPKGGFIPDYYTPGDIASRDIKAPKDLLIPDDDLTEKKRAEAEEATLLLYDFDSKAGVDTTDRLLLALSVGAKGVGEEQSPEALGGALEEALGVGLDEEEISTFSRTSLDDAAKAEVRTILGGTLKRYIVGNLKLFEADQKRGVVIRDLASQREIAGPEAKSVLDVASALDDIDRQLSGVKSLSGQQRQFLSGVVQKLVRPNLTFNKNETEERKIQAREAVKPALFQVKKGEMIVREGERVTSDQIKKLKALREIGGHVSTLTTGLGLLVSILLLFFSAHRFARKNISKYRPNNRDLLFLVITFVGLFALIKISIFISTALESAFPYIDSVSYYYVFPFAVGAMLVRIVLNSEVAFIFAILSSLLVGILFGNSLFISLYALVGSLTAAHWVRQCKERATLYLAGLQLSIINAGMIIGLYLMTGRVFDSQIFYKLGFGLVGGFGCAVIVTGTIPLVESLFKYATDIKLLELANMNKPVLRELMVQAPGTYHHSIIVGNLVEAAAEEIGANPLLARVAAYYHDIGKIRKPLYFVENMGSQENRHDKLAPSMSALILMSHVKDGVELARENGLGEPLIDILRQHHGTSLIKFFYDKAKTKEDPGVQQIDERDYRYPGPKPQTREAALIMLADAVEAASRTLADPTPARIRGMVQKIINNIFIDGQLDECELTLKDLHNIAKSFNRIMTGIFHHRIDYPEPAHKERDKEAGKRKSTDDTDREPAKDAPDRDGDSRKGGPEDLKRLGMS